MNRASTLLSFVILIGLMEPCPDSISPVNSDTGYMTEYADGMMAFMANEGACYRLSGPGYYYRDVCIPEGTRVYIMNTWDSGQDEIINKDCATIRNPAAEAIRMLRKASGYSD